MALFAATALLAARLFSLFIGDRVTFASAGAESCLRVTHLVATPIRRRTRGAAEEMEKNDQMVSGNGVGQTD